MGFSPPEVGDMAPYNYGDYGLWLYMTGTAPPSWPTEVSPHREEVAVLLLWRTYTSVVSAKADDDCSWKVYKTQWLQPIYQMGTKMGLSENEVPHSTSWFDTSSFSHCKWQWNMSRLASCHCLVISQDFTDWGDQGFWWSYFAINHQFWSIILWPHKTAVKSSMCHSCFVIGFYSSMIIYPNYLSIIKVCKNWGLLYHHFDPNSTKLTDDPAPSSVAPMLSPSDPSGRRRWYPGWRPPNSWDWPCGGCLDGFLKLLQTEKPQFGSRFQLEGMCHCCTTPMPSLTLA